MVAAERSLTLISRAAVMIDSRWMSNIAASISNGTPIHNLTFSGGQHQSGTGFLKNMLLHFCVAFLEISFLKSRV